MIELNPAGFKNDGHAISAAVVGLPEGYIAPWHFRPFFRAAGQYITSPGSPGRD